MAPFIDAAGRRHGGIFNRVEFCGFCGAGDRFRNSPQHNSPVFFDHLTSMDESLDDEVIMDAQTYPDAVDFSDDEIFANDDTPTVVQMGLTDIGLQKLMIALRLKPAGTTTQMADALGNYL